MLVIGEMGKLRQRQSQILQQTAKTSRKISLAATRSGAVATASGASSNVLRAQTLPAHIALRYCSSPRRRGAAKRWHKKPNFRT
jgi:hypothetical protein